MVSIGKWNLQSLSSQHNLRTRFGVLEIDNFFGENTPFAFATLIQMVRVDKDWTGSPITYLSLRLKRYSLTSTQVVLSQNVLLCWCPLTVFASALHYVKQTRLKTFIPVSNQFSSVLKCLVLNYDLSASTVSVTGNATAWIEHHARPPNKTLGNQNMENLNRLGSRNMTISLLELVSNIVSMELHHGTVSFSIAFKNELIDCTHSTVSETITDTNIIKQPDRSSSFQAQHIGECSIVDSSRGSADSIGIVRRSRLTLRYRLVREDLKESSWCVHPRCYFFCNIARK